VTRAFDLRSDDFTFGKRSPVVTAGVGDGVEFSAEVEDGDFFVEARILPPEKSTPISYLSQYRQSNPHFQAKGFNEKIIVVGTKKRMENHSFDFQQPSNEYFPPTNLCVSASSRVLFWFRLVRLRLLT
jgi:hypothetical protein